MKTACLSIVALVFTTVISPAANRPWGSPVDGPFSGPGNQWNVVPGSGDVAQFTGYANGSAFTVSLVGNVENQYLRLDGAGAYTVTLDLAGYQYTANTAGTVVGRDAGDRNTLQLTGGGTFQSVNLIVGSASTSIAKLSLLNGVTLTTSTEENQIGAYGNGTLEIREGSRFETNALTRVGRRATGAGTVLVTGSNSVWEANKALIFGNLSGATASISLLEGGRLEATSTGTDGAIDLANAVGSTVTVTISGVGSKLSSGGTIYLGGGRSSGSGGVANVTVGEQGSLTTGATLLIYSQAKLVLGDATALVTARDIGSADVGVSGKITLTLGNAGEAPRLLASRDVFLGDGTLSLSLSEGLEYEADDVIRLIGYGNSLTGTFSNFSEGQLVSVGGQHFVFSYTLTAGSDKFIGLTAVPEPGSVATGLLGLVIAVLWGKSAMRKGQ